MSSPRCRRLVLALLCTALLLMLHWSSTQLPRWRLRQHQVLYLTLIGANLTEPQVRHSEDEIDTLLQQYTEFRTEVLQGYDASRSAGSPLLVPNIVHFVRFGTNHMTFVEAMCIKAAYLRQLPDWLIIHTDQAYSDELFGRYWSLVSRLPRLRVQYLERPRVVFGSRVRVVQHASDVARLQLLMRYGGVYLDNDLLLLRSLDRWRRHDFCVPWPEAEKSAIGNQLLMSSVSAPFLYLYYDTYRAFDDKRWYYNAGELPTDSLLRDKPQLVHRISNKDVSVDTADAYVLYKRNTDVWRRWSAVHLLYGHRRYMFEDDYQLFPEHDPKTIYLVNNTFTALMRTIYDTNFGIHV